MKKQLAAVMLSSILAVSTMAPQMAVFAGEAETAGVSDVSVGEGEQLEADAAALQPASNLRWDPDNVGTVLFDDPNTGARLVRIGLSQDGGQYYYYDFYYVTGNESYSYNLSMSFYSSGTYTFTVQIGTDYEDATNAPVVQGPSFNYTATPRLSTPQNMHWSEDGTFSFSPVEHAYLYHYWFKQQYNDGSNRYYNTTSSLTSLNFADQMTDPDGIYAMSIQVYSDDLSVATGSLMSEWVYYKAADPQNPFMDVDTDDYYHDAVIWAKNAGITSGTNASSFSPRKDCTRGEMAMFLYILKGKPAVTGNNPFIDVSDSAYYRDAVIWCRQAGVTSGTGETTFSPNMVCTRAQMVQFLYVLAGKPAVSGDLPFTDVPAEAYYRDAVIWASTNGITSGKTATTFAPEDPCTRAQMVQLLYVAKDKL